MGGDRVRHQDQAQAAALEMGSRTFIARMRSELISILSSVAKDFEKVTSIDIETHISPRGATFRVFQTHVIELYMLGKLSNVTLGDRKALAAAYIGESNGAPAFNPILIAGGKLSPEWLALEYSLNPIIGSKQIGVTEPLSRNQYSGMASGFTTLAGLLQELQEGESQRPPKYLPTLRSIPEAFATLIISIISVD